MRALICFLALVVSVNAQVEREGRIPFRNSTAGEQKAGPQGFVQNGDFSKSSAVDNLWDGVNADGELAGEVREAYAVTEKGAAGEIALPVSVNFVDMNGDGLPDLVTADPAGTMRIYFNSGSKGAPKFTVAETVPLFLSRPSKDEEFNRWWPHGMAKIAMYDWNRSGSVDLLFGNYGGEVVFVPNAGTAAVPSFPQPPVYTRATIPLSKKGELWGNLFAPCVYDWNHDGKPDLLIGEGSYSANAVHLFLNEGSAGSPKFSEESRTFLCYGDGREHLVPTIADWNGDGEPDVLVGDRTGGVAVHLRHPNWKPGEELKFSQFVDFGGRDHLNIAITPTAVDYNEDGLFDILLGRADGRIQVAINKGTKGEPKFGKPEYVKGVDLWGRNILKPDGWTLDNGNARGNIYGYVSVMDQPSPGGGKILKMGYWPSPNKIVKLIHPTVIGKNTQHFWAFEDERWFELDARRGSEGKSTNSFTLRQFIHGLKVGETYTLNFKARGNRMNEGLATLALFGMKEITPTKFEKKERGTNQVRNEKTEELFITEPLQSGSTWQTVSKTFTIAFKDKEVKTLPEPTFAVLEFKAFLGQYDGSCEVCDISLMPGKGSGMTAAK